MRLVGRVVREALEQATHHVRRLRGRYVLTAARDDFRDQGQREGVTMRHGEQPLEVLFRYAASGQEHAALRRGEISKRHDPEQVRPAWVVAPGRFRRSSTGNHDQALRGKLRDELVSEPPFEW